MLKNIQYILKNMQYILKDVQDITKSSYVEKSVKSRFFKQSDPA